MQTRPKIYIYIANASGEKDGKMMNCRLGFIHSNLAQRRQQQTTHPPATHPLRRQLAPLQTHKFNRTLHRKRWRVNASSRRYVCCKEAQRALIYIQPHSQSHVTQAATAWVRWIGKRRARNSQLSSYSENTRKSQYPAEMSFLIISKSWQCGLIVMENVLWIFCALNFW